MCRCIPVVFAFVIEHIYNIEWERICALHWLLIIGDALPRGNIGVNLSHSYDWAIWSIDTRLALQTIASTTAIKWMQSIPTHIYIYIYTQNETVNERETEREWEMAHTKNRKYRKTRIGAPFLMMKMCLGFVRKVVRLSSLTVPNCVCVWMAEKREKGWEIR